MGVVTVSETSEQSDSLKTEVKDLLNKVILLTQDKDDDFLRCVGAYCKRVVKDEYEASHNEDQYYNSNCY